MRRVLAAVFVTLLIVLALALALAACWLGYTSLLRSQRERQPPELLAPPGGRWVDTGDVRMYLQEWGPRNGPVLLLAHGTGAWSGTWFELPDALARAGWRVVAVDLPPFGFSISNQRPSQLDYSRPAQARRLLKVIESLARPQVTLVGHSFGAGPALEAAMQEPARLRRLVLVDPALGLGAAGEPPACEPLPAWAELVLDQRKLRTSLVAAGPTYPDLTGRLLETFVHRKEAVTAERVRAYQLPMLRFGFTAQLGDWADAFARSACEPAASLSPQRLMAWSTAELPVLLLWGEEDTVTPIVQARALAAWLPHATLQVLPGLGHIPHLEDPAAFARALLAALGPLPQEPVPGARCTGRGKDCAPALSPSASAPSRRRTAGTRRRSARHRHAWRADRAGRRRPAHPR